MEQELDFSRRSPRDARRETRRWLASAAQAVLHWIPVWAPLVFLGQIVTLGWLPARAEEARLNAAETEVRARVDGLLDEERQLAEEARMLADDVFRERVRRSLVVPGGSPLTLERARSTRP